jgi:protein-disulfide isomerase
MNRRTLLVAGTATFGAAAFAGGAFYVASQRRAAIPAVQTVENADQLVRPHSPIIGPPNAPVTIVEFFDPACEACRAFHPIVKKIIDSYPGQIRLVIRYAAFHPGSAEAVRIIEAARLQDRFVPVLEALLDGQSSWASHRAGNSPDLAWNFAAVAGLDVERARRERLMPHITATLNFDAEDVRTFKVRGTPTFFVNGRPLIEFGADQLLALVRDEVARTTK